MPHPSFPGSLLFENPAHTNRRYSELEFLSGMIRELFCASGRRDPMLRILYSATCAVIATKVGATCVS